MEYLKSRDHETVSDRGDKPSRCKDGDESQGLTGRHFEGCQEVVHVDGGVHWCFLWCLGIEPFAPQHPVLSVSCDFLRVGHENFPKPGSDGGQAGVLDVNLIHYGKSAGVRG